MMIDTESKPTDPDLRLDRAGKMLTKPTRKPAIAIARSIVTRYLLLVESNDLGQRRNSIATEDMSEYHSPR
jgi:hypothetical protein